MADSSDTQLILQAIKTQGDKIGDLATAVNRLVEKVTTSPIQSVRNGWQSIAIMLAILAACFSPFFFAVANLREDIQEIRASMIADDRREEKNRRMFAGLDERFAEIETQFSAAKELNECRRQRIWDVIDNQGKNP